MVYKVSPAYTDYGLPFRFVGEEGVARFLEETGAPARYEVYTEASADRSATAVNGKRWLEHYYLDLLRRAALDNAAPDDDAPMYTCDEPPAWHEDAASVATVFAFLQYVPNDALDAVAVTTALTMAISGIVRYQNLERQTTDYLTVHDYVWALIRSMRTG